MRQHAACVGLTPKIESRTLDDGSVFAFAWFAPASFGRWPSFSELDEHLAVPTCVARTATDVGSAAEASPPVSESDSTGNTARISIALRTSTLTIHVPATTGEHCFYSHDVHGYIFSNDMRAMMRWARGAVDERGVCALFQYYAIPAPLTIAQGVQRIPNGHVLSATLDGSEPTLELAFGLKPPAAKRKPSPDDERRVVSALDAALVRVPRSSVLSFSGGVDSGLMASRFVEMGRTDIRLINYSFGPSDPDGEAATQMAKHLGLACERVTYDPAGLPGMLGRIGREYSIPFGDPASFPTSLLIRSFLSSLDPSHAVLDGSGADCTFVSGHTYRKWERVYSMPRWLRRIPAWAHRRCGLWHLDTYSTFQQAAEVSRISLDLPIQQAIVAMKPLDGIAYRMRREVREGIVSAIRNWTEVLSERADPRSQLSLLHLVLLCCGRAVPRLADPLRMRGVEAVYPFLDPGLVELAYELPWSTKCVGGEQKSLLKKILLRSMPEDLVYRRKVGFRTPTKDILATPVVQDFARGVVLSSANPLLDVCCKTTVKKMIERAATDRPLGTSCSGFLWCLVFASAWVAQLEL